LRICNRRAAAILRFLSAKRAASSAFERLEDVAEREGTLEVREAEPEDFATTDLPEEDATTGRACWGFAGEGFAGEAFEGAGSCNTTGERRLGEHAATRRAAASRKTDWGFIGTSRTPLQFLADLNLISLSATAKNAGPESPRHPRHSCATSEI
jgi:hypothetical protein